MGCNLDEASQSGYGCGVTRPFVSDGFRDCSSMAFRQGQEVAKIERG